MATCSGDGSVKLWDLTVRDGLPIARWKEHQGEVHNLDWSNLQKDTFLCASLENYASLRDALQAESLRPLLQDGFGRSDNEAGASAVSLVFLRDTPARRLTSMLANDA